MSSEESSQPQENKQQEPTYYARKKNWISGVDNDTVLGAGLGVIGIISAVAAYPVVRDIYNNFVLKIQQQQGLQQQLPNGEQYIPPTPPAPEPVVEQPPPPPVEEAPPQEEVQEEDGLFHENELRRKQKMLGKRQTRYESPFGKDIGGLG